MPQLVYIRNIEVQLTVDEYTFKVRDGKMYVYSKNQFQLL